MFSSGGMELFEAMDWIVGGGGPMFYERFGDDLRVIIQVDGRRFKDH